MKKIINLSYINPIIKTILSLFLTILNAIAVSLVSKIFLLSFSLLCLFFLEKKIKLRKFKVILIFFAVSFFSNIFITHGNIILSFGIIKLTDFFIQNFFMMFFSMSIFWAISTAMINSILASDIPYIAEFLLKPLKFFKVNISEISIIITLAMRFIPVVLEEINKVVTAQESRGASIRKGSIFKRIKFIFPIFVPVFASCFRKAINVATAMECRCYGAPFKRTKLKKNEITKIDVMAIFIVVFVIFGVIFCNTIKIF